MLKGLTQEAFAERLGLSQNSYSKIELGKTRLNLERLRQIADALQIDPVKLMEFDEKDSLDKHRDQEADGVGSADQLLETQAETIRRLREQNAFLRRQIERLQNKSDDLSQAR